ncbi:MAG: M48 family metalloprotease [Hyphomicrobiales bacterium]|nr:M48 family metalloprotease [Hyphomicrobiales bacterium]MCP5372514.1 M48 family metalloprotease [Hyphomicrobiales bacterium]
MCVSRRGFLTGLAASTAVAGLSGCLSTNAATGRSSFTGFASLDDDIQLGRREYPKLVESFGGAYEDRRLQSRLDAIGRALARGTEYPDLPYTFTVLNTPIVNAMALPGGYIGVTRGLLALASNEAELAGVMAHEMGHVTARHTAERQGRGMLAQLGILALGVATGSRAVAGLAAQGATAYLQSYSRDQELEADSLGVRYMGRAGYDPEAMATFLATLREQSILESRARGLPAGQVDEFNMMASHPRTADRVRAAAAQAQAGRPADARLDRDAYLALINGLMYGDDPDQGIVDGPHFAHPKLRFEFTAPPGFRLTNSDSRIVAQRGRDAAILFDMGRGGGDMAVYLRDRWAKGVRLESLERITVNGLPAAAAGTRGRTRSGTVEIRLVAIDRGGGSVARFLFLAPDRAFADLATDFKRTTYSFRNLSAREAAAIRAKRLIVVRTQAGDTVAKLAAGLPHGRFNQDWFRMLNDMGAREPLRPGRTVKVVVG